MNMQNEYLQVMWSNTSYEQIGRSVLKIPKENAKFMTKAKVKELSKINEYSYIPSLGDVYIKYFTKMLKSGDKVLNREMIIPFNLLLFRFQYIYPNKDYKVKCKCSDKESKFKYLMITPTIRELIEGIIDKINEYHIRLLSDINICLENEVIVGVYFKYEDSKGKPQRFLGR